MSTLGAYVYYALHLPQYTYICNVLENEISTVLYNLMYHQCQLTIASSLSISSRDKKKKKEKVFQCVIPHGENQIKIGGAIV